MYARIYYHYWMGAFLNSYIVSSNHIMDSWNDADGIFSTAIKYSTGSRVQVSTLHIVLKYEDSGDPIR